MTDNNPRDPRDPQVLAEVAGQHAKDTLEGLVAMARMHDGEELNAAAFALGKQLTEMVDANTLGQVFAHVLLDQVRTAALRDALPSLDSDGMDAVEIRVIGPDANAKAVLKRMADAGIPTFDQRGPATAYQRPDTVRYMAYTDPDTSALCRERHKLAHPRGRGKTEQ